MDCIVYFYILKVCLSMCNPRGQLQASESRYLAMRRVTQVLQTEMLQLYSQLDAEMLTTNQSLSESDTIVPSSAPPGTSR